MKIAKLNFFCITLACSLSLFSCEEEKKSKPGSTAAATTTTGATTGDATTTTPDTSSESTTTTNPTTDTSTTTTTTATSTDSLSGSGVLGPNGVAELKNLLGPNINATPGSTVWLQCDTSSGASQGQINFSGPNNTQVRIYGEICPNQTGTTTTTPTTGPLNVFFIVDFTTVMASNDSLIGNSCNRLGAVRIVSQQLDLLRTSFPTINAGLLRIDSQTRDGITLRPYDAFKNFMAAQYFCGYDPYATTTNYKAALDRAYSILASQTGPKVVYLITSGTPTAGGIGVSHADAAIQSAMQLRSIPDLRLEAVFLGLNSGGGYNNNTSAAINAQAFLAQLTGDASRVRTLTQTNLLAEALRTLSVSGTGTTSTTTTSTPLSFSLISALLTNSSGSSQNFALDVFTQHPQKPGSWIYGTSALTLTGTVGSTASSTAQIKVQGVNQSAQSSVFTSNIVINFTAQ